MLRNIFISYRREENKYQARMIFDAFQKAEVRVFYDIDSIPLGRDFRETIMDQVQKCDVLLALVGPNWAQCSDPKTRLPRLENADDFVRIEIGTALNRGIPVVPVLLDDASLPEADQLPNDLRNLFDRQAEFISFRTFDDDVKRLITKLKIKSRQTLEPSEPGEPPLTDRAAAYNFMGEIPRASFEIPTKISRWVLKQATIWLSVLKNPKEFVAGTDIDSTKALGDSIQFLFFVLVCMNVLVEPINVTNYHNSIFNPTYLITVMVKDLLAVLAFCLLIHLSAKAMRGKGSVSRTMTSMFYAAGIMPVLLIPIQIQQTYQPMKQMFRSGNFDWDTNQANPFVMLLIIAIVMSIYVYAAAKLVPVVKFVFSIGTIRALTALGVGGIGFELY